MQSALCALGAVLFSFGSLWLAIPAVLCALAAAALPSWRGHPAGAQVIFGAGFLRGLYWLLFEQSLVSAQRLEGFRGLTLLVFICASAYLCIHLRASLEKARFWVLIVLFGVLGVATEPRMVPLVAALVAGIAIGRSGIAGTAIRRSGTGGTAIRRSGIGGSVPRDSDMIPRSGAVFTGELAGLFLLYQPHTWEALTYSSGPVVVLPVVVLISLSVAVVSPRWAGRAAALTAAACAAVAWRSGHLQDGFWLSSALLCAAAAAFSLAANPSRAVAAAR
jgi:hypothetical protein